MGTWRNWVVAACLTGWGLTSAAVETPYGDVTLPFELHQVPDAPVYYVVGESGVPDSSNEGHTSNAGFVVTDEGVVVFDALGTPALGYRLLQKIREVTNQPVRRVVVSHYHADHIYGLQAFVEHTDAEVWAQEESSRYIGNDSFHTSENAQRRLEQRREALFPWVNEKTYLVAPDLTFERALQFDLGGVQFRLRHMGPAHAPGDTMMVVEIFGVVFSGDIIYTGRLPFLDSPEVDTANWLAGLEALERLQPRYVIAGHGQGFDNVQEATRFTRDYIAYLRKQMGDAVANFVPFNEAYQQTDWSRYENMPAFKSSNRGNAYRVFLEMEANSF